MRGNSGKQNAASNSDSNPNSADKDTVAVGDDEVDTIDTQEQAAPVDTPEYTDDDPLSSFSGNGGDDPEIREDLDTIPETPEYDNDNGWEVVPYDPGPLGVQLDTIERKDLDPTLLQPKLDDAATGHADQAIVELKKTKSQLQKELEKVRQERARLQEQGQRFGLDL